MATLAQDTYSMTIGGEAVTTAETMPVRNPATAEVFAQVPVASAEHLERAVAAATRAFPGWRDTPMAERKTALVSAADIIDAHVSELTSLFTREQGRPLPGAMAEINGAAM